MTARRRTESGHGRTGQTARATVLVAAILLALFAALFVALDRATISGDGLAMYLVAESLLRDGDFDFANQHVRYDDQIELMGRYALRRLPSTGRDVSPWPFGMALLWAPFLYISWWLDSLGWFPSPYVLHGLPLAGNFRAVGLAMALAANTWGLAAWGLAARVASSAVRGWEALLLAFTVFLGTPLVFYVTLQPSFSHVGDAATVAALVWAWFTLRRNSWTHGLTIGLIAGLAILVRWHLATYALILGGSCLLFREWRRAAGIALGIALVCWPISYSWLVMGGSPFRPPIFELSHAYVRSPQVVQVLFSDLRGLLPWSPVAALGLAGLFVGLGRHRRPAAELILCVAAQVVVSSMVWDWWAGHSFGSRRLVNLYALLVVGAAWLVEGAGTAAGRWGPRAARLARTSVLVVSGLLAWQAFVLVLHYQPSGLDPQWMTRSQLARHWADHGSWSKTARFHWSQQGTIGVLPRRGQPAQVTAAPGPASAVHPTLASVDVHPDRIVVHGQGFARGLVVNLFQPQDGKDVNLGGLKADRTPAITLRSFSDTRLELDVPADLRAGTFSVQIVNPPYRPDTASEATSAVYAPVASR